MKFRSRRFGPGVTLVILSAVIYSVHYVFSHDLHHILIYLDGDIAFVPVEVLPITLIIHSLLTAREKGSRPGKLNMVIGALFSQVGADLLVHSPTPWGSTRSTARPPRSSSRRRRHRAHHVQLDTWPASC